MSKFIDMTGQRYGRLVAVSIFGRDRHKKILWNFVCDCGKEHIAAGESVRQGKIVSCGCFRDENFAKRNTVHGFSRRYGKRKRIHKIWTAMIARCKYVKDERLNKWYISKGIKVCDRWSEFKNFLEDMGDSYDSHAEKFGERNTTIDRIDSKGNYCKENCRWATWKEQMNNHGYNTHIRFNGETKNLHEWAELFGIKPGTLSDRLRYGWTIEKALTKPVK